MKLLSAKIFMKGLILSTTATLLILSAIFTLTKQNSYNLVPSPIPSPADGPPSAPVPAPAPEPKPPGNLTVNPAGDTPNQPRLENPPEVIKAIYATSWSASSTAKMNYLIDLIRQTELNAIVIDLKDFSGLVTYDIKVPAVVKAGARQVRIRNINSLIKKLHDNGIYVIGRVTIFQDPILAKARPDLAVQNIETGKIWTDNKGLGWIDPGAKEAWDYNLSIAQDATARGFDEINFDYIRYPSDGKLQLMSFPHSDLTKEKKSDVIRRFFQYVKKNMSNTKTSADIFGLATVDSTDLGIGQIIEHAFENFDYVAPMIYPSHFAAGSFGYRNPAENAYEVIRKSMEEAYNRLINFNKKITAVDAQGKPVIPVEERFFSKLRPWLQSFDLGAVYDARKIKAQIQATTDALCRISFKTTTDPATQKRTTTRSCAPLSKEEADKLYNGWMLWDPRNNYIKSSLLPQS